MSRIQEALDKLFISSNGEIKSRIEEVSFNININNTNSIGYCHCLKFDANGNLRLKDLVEFMDTKILEYAIPKKEIEEARKYFNETGSPQKVNQLQTKAKALFTDLEKTGEGGELLLYILVQEFLRIPQLISKMSNKTSGKLHYQGADGIHVNFNPKSNKLELYWGESKMYSNLNDAMTNCFDSINGYLLDSQSASSIQERDLQLITSNINSNINDSDLEDIIVQYFDKDNDLSNMVDYKGLCFIGFDSKKYIGKNDTSQLKTELQSEVESWYLKASKKINSYPNLNLKELHVFLMPFPSVAEFREHYLNEIF